MALRNCCTRADNAIGGEERLHNTTHTFHYLSTGDDDDGRKLGVVYTQCRYNTRKLSSWSPNSRPELYS